MKRAPAFCGTSLSAYRKNCEVSEEPHFQQKQASRQAARAGLGAKPQMGTQGQSKVAALNS